MSLTVDEESVVRSKLGEFSAELGALSKARAGTIQSLGLELVNAPDYILLERLIRSYEWERRYLWGPYPLDATDPEDLTTNWLMVGSKGSFVASSDVFTDTLADYSAEFITTSHKIIIIGTLEAGEYSILAVGTTTLQLSHTFTLSLEDVEYRIYDPAIEERITQAVLGEEPGVSILFPAGYTGYPPYYNPGIQGGTGVEVYSEYDLLSTEITDTNNIIAAGYPAVAEIATWQATLVDEVTSLDNQTLALSNLLLKDPARAANTAAEQILVTSERDQLILLQAVPPPIDALDFTNRYVPILMARNGLGPLFPPVTIAIGNRQSLITFRQLEIQNWLGEATPTTSGYYFERYTILNIRVNRLGGSLGQIATSDQTSSAITARETFVKAQMDYYKAMI